MSRGVSAMASEPTDAKRLQLEYWTAFRQYLQQSGTFIRPTKPLPQTWMNIALGRTGFYLSAIASMYDSAAQTFDGNELRAEFAINADNAKQYFAAVESQKPELERALGEPLVWHNPPDSKSAKVYLRRSADLEDRSDWPRQHQWLREKLEKLHRTFAPVVKRLDLSSAPPSEESAG